MQKYIMGKSSFFCLNKMKRGKQMKNTRRIVSLAICIAMLLSVCLFTGCSGQGSAEGAFKAYMKAQENADSYAVIDLMAPAFYDYRIKLSVEEYGNTEEEAREAFARGFLPRARSVDAKMVGENYDPTTECDYTYEITGTKKGSSAQVKEVNEYVKNKYDIDLDASQVTVIKYTYSVKSKSGILDLRETETYGVAFKINGSWYYHNGGIGREFLWMTKSGLLVEDGVKWIMDYIEVSYDF